MRFHEFQKLKEFDASAALSSAGNIMQVLTNPLGSLTDIAGGIGGGSAPTPGASNPLSIDTGGKVSVHASEVSSYLKSKMDDYHRLGMLVNIYAESGFNSAALIIDSNKKPSGGLFQHNGERFTNMVNAVGSDWKTDWQGQIDFALSEPAGRKYLSEKFKSSAEAAAWWTMFFEKPKNPEQKVAARLDLLKNFA